MLKIVFFLYRGKIDDVVENIYNFLFYCLLYNKYCYFYIL